ncbi:hypothetical protein F5B21DRAFT_200459 [Xylaria acuta]|nr:hypothetical protein F5B21DRAFT_200459 [Xylaria acuta]
MYFRQATCLSLCLYICTYMYAGIGRYMSKYLSRNSIPRLHHVHASYSHPSISVRNLPLTPKYRSTSCGHRSVGLLGWFSFFGLAVQVVAHHCSPHIMMSVSAPETVSVSLGFCLV